MGVRENNKENSCCKSEESVFLGQRGSAFFCLTQIETQRTGGNERRAGTRGKEGWETKHGGVNEFSEQSDPNLRK